jgi:hypothetical protein
MGLTVGEVALIAAGIGLASPLIAYWTTTQLDRERWIRAERSKVYVEMLAVYGRMAQKASHQEEQYSPLPPEEWRLLQARVEAFASDRVLSLRDPYLDAWNRFLHEDTALGSISEATDPSTTKLLTQHNRLVHEYSLEVGNHYDGLRVAIREELRIRRVSRRP